MKVWPAVDAVKWISVIFVLLAPFYGRTYKLRESVEVRTEVRLADLLPSDASTVLRRASSGIDLCRPPQPGTVRVLSADFIAAKLDGVDLLRRRIVLPAEVIVHRAAWRPGGAAMREAVLRFLAQSGASHTELPPETFWDKLREPLMERPSTSFEVVDMRRNAANTETLAELRCIPDEFCHRFLLQIPLPAPEKTGTLAVPTSENGANDNSLVHSGTTAMAILQTDGMKMSQPVICLESGRLGQSVRVLNPQTHRVFFADVIAPNLLAVESKPSPTAVPQL